MWPNCKPDQSATRKRPGYTAFAHTTAYDAAIRDYLAAQGDAGTTAENVEAAGEFPAGLHLDLDLVQAMRYGENPHQAAALYNLPGIVGPLGGQVYTASPFRTIIYWI